MSQKTVLVTGGAGFIGSHMVKVLLNEGYHVLVLDNLSHGHRDAVIGAELIVADLTNTEALHKLFQQYSITTVMHFASLISVGASVKNPILYYQNNTYGTLNLLEVMRYYDVRQFIFSSTAAIFGNPEYTPIDTEHPKNPINPYGRSKWLIEQILADYEIAYGLRSICLRYFNAAGADPDGQLGDRHNPHIHLIPLTLLAAIGKHEAITIYGEDYATPDGTCIRDYIHVMDLCQAHLLALQALECEAKSTAYNLGNGTGFSVREVINMAKEVSGKPIKIIQGERREGDPAILIADSRKIQMELGWQPKYPELKTIVEDAWKSIVKFYA